MPRHVHQDSNFLGETLAVLFLRVLQPARVSERPYCCNLQQRPNSFAKLFQQSSEKYIDIIASARRSGQEDFQRGTPPVSLASRSISPFLRACIVTEGFSTDHDTDSTGTSILIPLLLINFNTRLYGNPTAWYLFFGYSPVTYLTGQRRKLTGKHVIVGTLICWSILDPSYFSKMSYDFVRSFLCVVFLGEYCGVQAKAIKTNAHIPAL